MTAIFVEIACVLGIASLVSQAVFAQQPTILTCVYASWASYRKLPGRVMGNELPAQLCTHAVYLYAAMQNYTIVPFDPFNDMSGIGRRGNYEKFISLKTKKNPRLKTLIAIGGWNAGGFMFSQMAMVQSRRKLFIDSVVAFCRTYGFDGLMIDWLTPGVGTRGGDPEDYANFPVLLKEMKGAFRREMTGKSEDLLVAITISADVSNIDYYDVENLNSGVDIYYLLAYDFYGPWSKVTYHSSPLFNQPGNYSMDTAVQGWLKTSIDRKKVAIAITLTARSYSIPVEDNDDSKKIGVKILGDGRAGPITVSSGTFAYLEVCRMLATATYTVIRDFVAKVPHGYSYDGDLWFSYEEIMSVKDKANYTMAAKLGGGVMIFSTDQDDPHGYCGTPYPLSRAVRNVLSPLPKEEEKDLAADLSLRLESRCMSLNQPDSCEITMRCPRISPASFSPGELDCPFQQNCTFPTSLIDCVVPPQVNLNKDKGFYVQSNTNTPATYVLIKCRGDLSSTSNDSPGKFYVCADTGFGGTSIQEYVCPKGTLLRGSSIICIPEQA